MDGIVSQQCGRGLPIISKMGMLFIYIPAVAATEHETPFVSPAADPGLAPLGLKLPW